MRGPSSADRLVTIRRTRPTVRRARVAARSSYGYFTRMKSTLLALSLLGLTGCYGGSGPAPDHAPDHDPARPGSTARSCATDWCINTVLHGTHDLQNVWALTPTDAWAADLFGHLYHWS